MTTSVNPASEQWNPTLSDDANHTERDGRARGITIQAEGTVVLEMISGDIVTRTGLNANIDYPYRVKRVVATGTTVGANNIFLLA